MFTISPMIHNWVVKGLSARVFANIDEFDAFVASGDFERVLRAAGSASHTALAMMLS